MNIHIKDEGLFKALKDSSLVACQFGSHLYNTNDELSDKDIHYVYTTSVGEMNSFLREQHHHIQYCEDGVDHVFVSFHNLIRNVINGDSTVLFEIIHSNSLIGTPLEFIHNFRSFFVNYSIIRSYTGLGNRDCKHYHKKETHRDQIKALGHIYRGYFFAKSLMEDNFRLVNDEFLQTFEKIKSIEDGNHKDKKLFLQKGQELITNLREELNNRFNNKTLGLPKYMSVENQIILDEEISELMCKNIWFTKQRIVNNNDIMSLFYDAFENGINY